MVRGGTALPGLPFLRNRVTLTVRITRAAFVSMRAAYGSTRADLETGGALFGVGELDTVMITAALGPGPNAVQERALFLRDLAYTQAAAEQLYRTNGSQWIGEWHSHPNGPPEPSARDVETYARHLSDLELQFTHFVALIVSRTVTGATVTAWVLVAPESGLEICAATLSVEDDEAATPA